MVKFLFFFDISDIFLNFLANLTLGNTILLAFFKDGFTKFTINLLLRGKVPFAISTQYSVKINGMLYFILIMKMQLGQTLYQIRDISRVFRVFLCNHQKV